MAQNETFKGFFATPQDELKEFKRPGGFAGKSISPYYLVKRLTEKFGLCGKGWMVKPYETKIVEGRNGVIAVYICLSLFYKEQGDTEWNEVGPHWGGDVAFDIPKVERQKKNADGTFNLWECDDEAFKKAYTDAFSKCCSWIGLGGDIHDGLCDGNKYLNNKPWDVDLVAAKKAALAPVSPHDEPPPPDEPPPQEFQSEVGPIEWSDEERESAKQKINDLMEVLLAADWPEEKALDRLKNQRDQIGDPDVDFARWENRYLALNDRLKKELLPEDAWTPDLDTRFAVLMGELKAVFVEAGHPEAFAAKEATWKANRKNDPPSKVIPALEKSVQTLKKAAEAAAKKAREVSVNPTPAPTPATVKTQTSATQPTSSATEPVTLEQANAALNAAGGRFFAAFKAQGLGDEAKLKTLVKETRDKILRTLTFTNESQPEKIAALAKAMQAEADKQKLP